jgi:hypothetical protein
VPLAIAATAATLRSQLVAIDRNWGLGGCVQVQRAPLLRPSREFRDLARLSVRLKSRRTEGASTAHHYNLDRRGRGSILPVPDEARRDAAALREAEGWPPTWGVPLTVDGN